MCLCYIMRHSILSHYLFQPRAIIFVAIEPIDTNLKETWLNYYSANIQRIKISQNCTSDSAVKMNVETVCQKKNYKFTIKTLSTTRIGIMLPFEYICWTLVCSVKEMIKKKKLARNLDDIFLYRMKYAITPKSRFTVRNMYIWKFNLYLQDN